ncbi:MAG TPA: hypothetical protein ENM99_06295 [Desulfurella acetivorans]|uniref:Chalcone isomerase domain-containing protein n=1 Tax=Desulfurella acetivorans TaxID=33002 RepID=A0A7C6A7N4_DESAE|nr:hypothetical protein [Desulfurella acetivorans]
MIKRIKQGVKNEENIAGSDWRAFFVKSCIGSQCRRHKCNGNTQVYKNGSLIGQVQSPELQKAIIMVYFGPKPPDKSMKEGMLGK